MKLLCVLILMAAFAPLAADSLALKITLVEKERSKDSNTTTEVVSIEDGYARYTRSYRGYHPSKDYRRTKKYNGQLSQQQLAEIKQLILKLGLNKTVKEKKAANSIGRALKLNVRLKLHDTTFEGQVEGMQRDWRLKKSNLKHQQYIKNVKKLIYKIKKRIK